jgi:hypothetical protein
MIKVVREPEEETRNWGALEQCCFCWKRTPFWYEPKDVAVCPECAETHKAKDVPKKEIWCEQAAARPENRRVV